MNRDNYLKEGTIPNHLKPDPPLTLPPLPKHLKGTVMEQITTSSYIPTIFTMPSELNVGEYWYVKFPNVNRLVEVVIGGVTSKTVVLSPTEENRPTYRYKKTDIEFVEKVEKL